MATPLKINPTQRKATTRDEIDEAARLIARQVLARSKRLNEQEARWGLAALIYQSDVPESTVRRAVSGKLVNQQIVSDSCDYVREQLIKMIAVAPYKLDLRRIAEGASLYTWASRIISGPMVFPKKNFNTRTRQLREVTVSDDTLSNLITLRSMSDFGLTSLGAIDDARHDTVDEFLLLSKGTREREMVHLSAEHLCAIFGVMAPRRYACRPGRVKLLRRLESDVDAVRQDLSQYIDDHEMSNDSLAIVFTNLPDDEISAIARLDANSSQILARSALTPIPPPRRIVVNHLQSVVLKESRHKPLAQSISAAYAEVISEAEGSEFNPDVTAHKIKTLPRRRRDVAEWNRAVETLVGSGVTSFGETPGSVLTELSCLARQFEVERARAAA